jgi:hypothetical protein
VAYEIQLSQGEWNQRWRLGEKSEQHQPADMEKNIVNVTKTGCLKESSDRKVAHRKA